jgi:peptidoglycan-associated lipoprotein
MKASGLIFILSFSVLINFPIAGQNKKTSEAESKFNAAEYYDAVELYKKAYNSINDKTGKAEILYKIATCYRLTNEPLKAELWYGKSIGKGIKDPQAIFYLAEMQKQNLKYAEAKENFKKFSEISPDDPRGKEGIHTCELALKWMDNPNGYIVENMKFFNSKQDDYCPAYGASDYSIVYFTSSRKGTATTIHGGTGQFFADIYFSKMDRQGIWSTPKPVPGTINTDADEGSPCFSKDYKTMYFTRCEKVKNKNMGCRIYYSQIKGEIWGKERLVGISADDTIVIAHPAISPDELTLYFVSDMAGGQGGKDIWKVTRTSKGSEWSKPVNLGPQINTSGDEVFPYVHADGTLYFSSNGLPGMGGLDIFKAIPNDDGTWKVENLEYPINSHADDFGIVFQNDKEKGFFSSSRNLHGDDDIYAFSLPPLKFVIVGSVRDEKTDKPLNDVNVKSISSDGISIDTKTDKTGIFRLNLKPNTDYVFIAAKEGYLNGKDRETTKGLDHSRDFKTDILMASTAKPIELPNIFYDFAKWDLRPESMVSLDKLVETLNDNPNITIELGSHTDSRGSDADNFILSQKRAQSVVNYLIEKGIASDRLVAKGYGKIIPKVVDEKLADQYSFLKAGTVLSESYINSLSDVDLQEIANQINRRTEFKVLTNTYKPK